MIVEVGVRPATMRDIQVDGRLLHMWRGMLRDMYNLMRHAIGAMILVTLLRRTLACYRCGRDATHDRKSASSDNASSNDHDQGSDHCSPRIATVE